MGRSGEGVRLSVSVRPSRRFFGGVVVLVAPKMAPGPGQTVGSCGWGKRCRALPFPLRAGEVQSAPPPDRDTPSAPDRGRKGCPSQGLPLPLGIVRAPAPHWRRGDVEAILMPPFSCSCRPSSTQGWLPPTLRLWIILYLVDFFISFALNNNNNVTARLSRLPPPPLSVVGLGRAGEMTVGREPPELFKHPRAGGSPRLGGFPVAAAPLPCDWLRSRGARPFLPLVCTGWGKGRAPFKKRDSKFTSVRRMVAAFSEAWCWLKKKDRRTKTVVD